MLCLQARKNLLVPTPRLRTGLFNKIMPPEDANKEMLRKCSTALVGCLVIYKFLLKRFLYLFLSLMQEKFLAIIFRSIYS